LPSKYLSACRDKRTSKGTPSLSGQFLIPISSAESSPFVERVRHESGMTAFIFNDLVIGMTPAYLRIEKRRRQIDIKMARCENWHRQ